MKFLNSIQQWSNSLTVRQKGILVVSIPLAFQLLFTLSLGLLYAQAEREAMKEAHARLFSVRMNTIVKDIWNAGELLFAYSLLRDKAILDKWTEKKSLILEELDSLKRLSMDSASSKDYGTMVNVSNKGIALMERAVQKMVESSNANTEVFTEISPFLESLSKELESSSSKEVKYGAKVLVKENNSRKIIAGILYLSVIADVTIAIALSVFFAASIAQRLRVISDNTRRIRENQPLNPLLQGNDEIASLDHQFHDLVNALRSSELLRREFLAMTSHDLKTPLMSVELSLDLIGRQLPKDANSDVEEELNNAKSNMQRILSLINDLLDLERGASGKLHLELEDLSLENLLKRSCQSVKPLADRKNISLEINSADFELLGDRRRLEQVLVNLIANAVKFSAKDSTVSISCKDLGAQVEIRIRDNGIGIEECNRERIFERFEQAGPGALEKDFGSGLGLAICKTIVQAHGGQIGVEANPEGGSEFWFRIAKAE